MKKQKPKIILWDIETSLMVLSKFDLYPDYIGYKHIIKDWYIICASWMELGEKKAHSIDITLDRRGFKKNPYNDYIVVKKLREVLEDADLLIAHNGDEFDLKKFNSRLIYHNLDPLPPLKTLDTKKEAKRIAKFSSNRQDYLLRFFGLGSKIHMEVEDWIDILNGGSLAVLKIKKMVRYNKADVIGLKKLYLKLRKYIRRHPILFPSVHHVCPVCGSYNLQKRGTATTITVRYQRLQCQDCGSWSRERVSTMGGDKPKNIPI